MGTGSGLADVEALSRAGQVLLLGDRNKGPQLDEIYFHGAPILSRRMVDLQTAMVTLDMASASGSAVFTARELPAFRASDPGSFGKLARRVPKKAMDPERPASYTASAPKNPYIAGATQTDNGQFIGDKIAHFNYIHQSEHGASSWRRFRRGPEPLCMRSFARSDG